MKYERRDMRPGAAAGAAHAKARVVGGIVALTLGALLASCGGGTGSGDAEPRPVAVRLVEAMGDGEVANAAARPQVEPTVWKFDGSSPGLGVGPAVGWRATEVGDGLWRGTTAAPKAVLELTADGPLGDGDSLWAVEIRMKVSAGEALRFTVLDGEGPPGPAFAAPDGPPAGFSETLVPGEMTTYRVERARAFPMGPNARTDVQRVVLLPTDAPGAEVEIESVRLEFRREHMAEVASGVGWHGLGEVWKESLASRPGEEISLTVDLPERPFLDLSVGTVSLHPVVMEVAVASAETAPHTWRRVVSEPESWQPWQIDLAGVDGLGDRATVTLRTRSAVDDAVALWGAPVVRGRLPGGSEAAAAAGDAAGTRPPQGVILFLSDTLRRDHLSIYGYERETSPTLTALAQEGVVFDDAVAQGVWTKVSVPSILTSLYPGSHGIVHFTDRLPAAVTTLAEMFQGAGYATWQTSSVPFSGQLTNLHQGVEEMHEIGALNGDERGGGSYSKTSRPWMDRLLPWIESKKDVPFFALLHTFDAHHPFPPRPPFDVEWGADGARQLHAEEEDTVRPFIEDPLLKLFTGPRRADLDEAGLDADAWVQREVDFLDGSLLAQDAEIDRLLAHLEALGLRDEVLIVFVSDHGTELLDHDSHWHGTTVYSEQTDVPLVFWGPGVLPAGGLRVERPVENLDVLPTIAELAGLEIPEQVQGRSLLPLIRAAEAGVEPEGWRDRPTFSERDLMDDTFASHHPMRSAAIREGRWKLIRNTQPPEWMPEIQLFDRRADPRERSNLADQHPEVVTDLLQKLDRWEAWTRENRVEGHEESELTDEELKQLQSLGYI